MGDHGINFNESGPAELNHFDAGEAGCAAGGFSLTVRGGAVGGGGRHNSVIFARTRA